VLALVFRVGQERYALPCQQLIEVVPLVTLRPIAHAPDYVAGMFVLRGEVVAVVDLCRLMLGTMCPDRLSSRIMLARLGTHILGILAEQVTEAVDLVRQASAISVPAAPYLGDLFLDQRDPNAGAAGTMVQLLEVGKLLPQELQQRLLGGG
jgi:chemotaxis-related protein WspB